MFYSGYLAFLLENFSDRENERLRACRYILCFLRFPAKEWKLHLFEDKLILALVMIPLSFLITTPYAVLDAKNWFAGLSSEFVHYRTGHDGMEGSSPLLIVH